MGNIYHWGGYSYTVNDSDKALLNQAMADTIRSTRMLVRGRTQQMLADEAGVNIDTLKNIERAKYKISMQQVTDIALALGKQPAALVQTAWDLFNERRGSVSEAPATNVIYDPRFQSPDEIDANATGEARAANTVDDEGGDRPDN